MKFIEQVIALGDRVSARMGSEKKNLLPIGDFFHEELRQFAFSKIFSLGTFAEELVEFKLPTQWDRRGDFGQPALTLYGDPLKRFVIEIYIWQNIDTAIHDHSFTGAGQVIYGRSLESLYRYQEHTVVSEYLGVGDLKILSSRILELGDVFKIPASNKYIHQVHHLAKPTMSLIGRTTADLGPQPQRMYYKPGLRIDRRAVDKLGPDFNKKTEFLSLLRNKRDPAEKNFLRGLMKKSDGSNLWIFFLQFLRNGPNWAEVEDTVSWLEQQFGAWANVFRGLALSYLPEFQLTTAPPKDSEENLFLILLCQWGLGKKMESILAQAFPGKPGTQIVKENLQRLASRRGFNAKWLRCFLDVQVNPGKYSRDVLAKRHCLTSWDERLMAGFNLGDYLQPEEIALSLCSSQADGESDEVISLAALESSTATQTDQNSIGRYDN